MVDNQHRLARNIRANLSSVKQPFGTLLAHLGVPKKNTSKTRRFLRCFDESGGHGTRTRSPLRGTSVPMRPLTNSLILRLQLSLRGLNRFIEMKTELSQLRSADQFNEFLVTLKPA